MSFPQVRMKRLRENPSLRAMVREARLDVDDLIMPLFVDETLSEPKPIGSMAGQRRNTIPSLVAHCQQLKSLGLRAVILFGIPAHKDEQGSQAYAADGIVQRAIHEVKQAVPDLLIVSDVCMCEFTSTGHCGVFCEGRLDNDATIELLADTALSHAQAGADVIAPSDMADGRVGVIRGRLDEAGLSRIPIMSYAAKYASAYYGPFRDAADSAPQFGDRRGYQMDPANSREALREVELDLAEGADIVMVKPALAYLDIVRAVRERFSVPIAAYNVSGEYAMVKAAAERGFIDERAVVLESLTAMKRAGADIILSYHAEDVARWQ